MGDKIFSALDYAHREGVKTVKERIEKICNEMVKKNILNTPFDDCEPVGKPVLAEVNCGQWIARCECGGAEAVDYNEPIFYCFSCGNYTNHGKPRKVIFPDKHRDIERILLKRPVTIKRGTDKLGRLTSAIPVKYPRAWIPGETVKDLIKQNKEIDNG